MKSFFDVGVKCGVFVTGTDFRMPENFEGFLQVILFENLYY